MHSEPLSNIALITFDVFGTLLDWQAYIENTFPGRYHDFTKASDVRQRHPESMVLPYSALLAEIYTEMLPKAGPHQAQSFAHNFGRAAPFGDVSVLSELRRQYLVGCISNSDFRHQLDVQRQLGLVWDICLTAEELGDYKPSASLWERAVARVRLELGIKPEQWLHVSSHTDFDLAPASKLGIKTCFVPRPGGSPAVEAQFVDITTMVSDLHQLQHGLSQAQGAPTRYRVVAHANHARIANEFVRWMRHEHGNDLLKARGCQEFRVYRLQPEVVACEYLFRNQTDLQRYLERDAPRLRARGRELFPEHLVRFERDEASLEVLGETRKPQDFRT